MSSTHRSALPYLALGAATLGTGAVIGAIASLCHGWPGLYFDLSAFRTLRPLHVTFSVGWIFLAYMGALHAFLPRVCRTEWASPALSRAQLALFAAAGIAAPATYLFGTFSGREYLDFVPWISALILLAWAAFLANFILTVRRLPRPWPVYVWMWGTGLILFALTFVEGHLYLIPYFRDNLARDLTVQWKSYGALVGSWNLVIYGLSIYMSERISGDETIGRSRLAFFFYWLGVANLMFGWAHHTFQVPQSLLIRQVAFGMSMTEWVILIHLLGGWTGRETSPRDPSKGVAHLFLRSANLWIGINLALALLISIPSLNALTHGTPVTIAHAMGTTIGINTMILLSCVFYILAERGALTERRATYLRVLVPYLNFCLAGLFVSLLLAGSVKGKAMLVDGASFYAAVETSRPYLKLFSASGIFLAAGLAALAGHMLAMLRAHPDPLAEWPASVHVVPRPVYAAIVIVVASLPWWLPSLSAPDFRAMLSYPPGDGEAARRGRQVFAREACWKCHAAPTAMNAPDLSRKGSAWSEGWHVAHLFDPRSCRSTSTMPSFAHLFDGRRPKADASDLVDYLLQLQRVHARRLSESVDQGLPPAPNEPDVGRGGRLYQTHCAVCHGSTGGGDGPAAVFFEGETLPRDLTRGYFRNRSTLDLPTVDDVFLTITHGMPGSAMAGFKDLSTQDRRDLAAYVLTLNRRPADRKPAPVPEPPPISPELVERGKELIQMASCAQCHGEDLRGLDGEDRGFAWTDESGRPVPRSADLTSGVFKSGSSPSRLYRTLYYGRPGAPMPCYNEMFASDEERWALVHFLRSLSK